MIYNIARTIDTFFSVLVWLIIIRSFASIIVRDYSNPLVRALYEITEPILAPFRKILSALNVDTGMIDFSPLLAVIGLNIIKRVIIGFIF